MFRSHVLDLRQDDEDRISRADGKDRRTKKTNGHC